MSHGVPVYLPAGIGAKLCCVATKARVRVTGRTEGESQTHDLLIAPITGIDITLKREGSLKSI